MNELSKLAETGLLGLLLVIALLGVGFMYREIKAERDARLLDLQKYSETDRLFISQIKETLENILSLIRGGK